MAIPHDQMDAPISISITILTVKVARKKRARTEKSMSAAVWVIKGIIVGLVVFVWLACGVLVVIAKFFGVC